MPLQMNDLKAAARSFKRWTASESNTSDPILYSPRCGRCSGIVLCYYPWRPGDERIVRLHQVYQDIIKLHKIIEGGERIVDNGISKGCSFCKMIKDHQDTFAQFDTLGESPHLVALFQEHASSSYSVQNSPRNTDLRMWAESCVEAFATKTGDFVLSVNQGKH